MRCLIPYIDPEERDCIVGDGVLYFGEVRSPGQLNFAITYLCRRYMDNRPANYSLYNEVIGVLECAKTELYRVGLAPVEDVKRSVNGEVL